MDNVSKHQYAPPLFVWPNAKFRNVEEEFRWIQFGEPPNPPNLYNESSSSLSGRGLQKLACLFCGRAVRSTYHSCRQCYVQYNQAYHKECLRPLSKHPYHPKHSLRFQDNWMRASIQYNCSCCSKEKEWVYRCSICDFTVCEDCARKPPVFAINQPKRHEHTLTFFPRKGSLICDVCALSDHASLMYSCTQCDYVAHKYCVNLPWVIRMSRHDHRLSFTSLLTPERLSCGVCRGKIDTNYGRYLCVKGCSYGVHSKCATRKDIWDGKELEGAPEDTYEDIKPFNEVSNEIIQHFSHQNHHMKLDDDYKNREFDENKCCQACTLLPICDDIIYSCIQCDYILHQACANLPRKKQHAMHPHPLALKVEKLKEYSSCGACGRNIGNGFMYACQEKEKCTSKRIWYFQLDVRCASISEPFSYWNHPHSLFLTSKPEFEQSCSICRSEETCLNCGECEFVLCFKCATLPEKLKHKHDEHFLVLSYGHKDANGKCWCDICEQEANPKYGIYMCNECNITVDIKCLLAEDKIYVIPRDDLINIYMRNTNIIPNSSLTRDKCSSCHNFCKGKVVYILHDTRKFCSLRCIPLW